MSNHVSKFQDSTIDFEKRRNVPVRYDRGLVQTTIKAMKRIGEIKARRERAFFKNRFVHTNFVFPDTNLQCRMATARAKQRTHRQKALEKAKASVKLHEPMVVEEESLKVAERIKAPSRTKSSMVQGDGRSMGMEVD